MCQLNVEKLKFYWKFLIRGPIAALLPDYPKPLELLNPSNLFGSQV